MDNAFWCIHCLRQYSSKFRFNSHFDSKNVQGQSGSQGGKLVTNSCYDPSMTNARIYGRTLKEAKSIKRQMETATLANMFQPKRPRLGDITDQKTGGNIPEITIQDECTSCNPESVSCNAKSTSTIITMVECADDEQVASSSGVNDKKVSISDTIENDAGIVSEECFEKPNFDIEYFYKSLDEMKESHETIIKLLTSSAHLKSPNQNTGIKTDNTLIQDKSDLINISLLRHARSVKSVMTNPLVKEYFQLIPTNKSFCKYRKKEDLTEKELPEDQEFYIECLLCINEPWKSGISIKNRNYSCPLKSNLESWFRIAKQSLVRHIQSDSHWTEKKGCAKKKEELDEEIEKIKQTLRHLVYYVIKTNTAFLRFPTLLATAFQCGLQIGDINHTRDFARRILPLINDVLQENTKEWLHDQTKMSISLDIGTFFGLVLLVVYFIGANGTVRLAGCELTSSKEGEPCAKLCFKIATSNIHIQSTVVRQKTTAIIADGQFTNGNQPFKAKMRELFQNPNLLFRWDLLHLCNRAHIAARGPTGVDTSQLADGQQQHVPQKLITKLMNYIQSESKAWRTGIRYTQLVIETLDFMRPKIFSSTRMCLYEFEQVKRFIEVFHYFDVPWEYEVMCCLYIFVLFAEKIMLKTVQKTNNQAAYVRRVFLASPPQGKLAMELCLRVGEDVIRGRPIQYLDTGNFVDILSTDPNQNHFIADLKKMVNELGAKLVPNQLINPTPRRRNQAQIDLPFIIRNVEQFIDKFWDEFQDRRARTNLESNDSWCFSEAPCESFFSIWDRFTMQRQSLAVENVVYLVRIFLEGPPAGTKAAKDLMNAAMQQYLTISHLGERYTTIRWIPNRVSSTVRNEMQNPWKFAGYSNF